MTLLTQLEQRATAEWLLGVSHHSLVQLAQDRLQKLISLQSITPHPTVLIAEPDPTHFLASFIAACTANCPVFLCNPNWGDTEWQQVSNLVQPDLIWGTQAQQPVVSPCLPFSPSPRPLLSPNWIMLPTGGSSGQIRFAIHTWKTLTAAVEGFQSFFEVDQINSCCVLPLYHVSGLMQFVRSFSSGGKLAVLPFKSLDQWLDGFDPTDFFLSLVPTQLQKLLQNPQAVDWLAQFHTVFLGGAPAWAALLIEARRHQVRLAPTYGMTETAAQIATLKPDAFLRGETGCGQVLPHVKVKIGALISAPVKAVNSREIADSTKINNSGKWDLRETSPKVGTIVIEANSLMLGYFPHAAYLHEFQTDDLGFFDQRGLLQIVGRNSLKIITGGENVFPAEVEAALLATGLINDVCVIGMPDQTWGERVTAIFVPRSLEVTVPALKAALAPKLSHFKHPKQWITVKTLPRNAQGKINYEQIKQFL